MLVARVFDGGSADDPWVCPERPRLVDPELRHRVVGYLAHGCAVEGGSRTDGVWVWPDALAESAYRGVGPPLGLLDHMELQGFVLTARVSAEVLDLAADRAGRSPATGPPRPAITYLIRESRPGREMTLLRRVRQPDGSLIEATFAPDGWQTGDRAGISVVEISARHASELMDQLCSAWYDEILHSERESAEVATPVRLARTFDGKTTAGGPAFTPVRRRVIEPGRRERLAAYLLGGRLVMRAAGRGMDPLTPGGGPVVPLSYRTDGSWVWQEALGYYLRTRGVGPELAFLCHIEQRAYRVPEGVTDEAAMTALAVVRAQPAPLARPDPWTYYAAPSATADDLIVRAARGNIGQAELLGRDLRWRRLRGPRAADIGNLAEISPEQASAILDARCAVGAEV